MAICGVGILEIIPISKARINRRDREARCAAGKAAEAGVRHRTLLARQKKADSTGLFLPSVGLLTADPDLGDLASCPPRTCSEVDPSPAATFDDK